MSFEKLISSALEKVTNKEWQELKIAAYNEAEGDLNKKDGYSCEICKNKGHFLIIDDNGVELYHECKCKKAREAIKKANRSSLGNVITQYTFSNFETTEAWQKHIKDKAIEFCSDNNSKWFYMGGQSGCGKTHICTAIFAHYIKQGGSVRFMTWQEDAKRLKALVNEPEYQKEIDEYKNVDVLYIDDFLKTTRGTDPTAGDLNIAFEIINRRLLNNNAITIISSETPLDGLIDYDEATMSRIYQNAGKFIITIDKDRGKNYRLKTI